MPRPPLRTISGVGFVAAFIAGALAYGSGAGSSDAEITSYYASHSNRIHQIIGFALIAAAVVLFVAFVAALRDVVGGGPSIVAFVSGGCTAALLFTANALCASSAFTLELESGYRIDARTHLLVEDAGFALFVSAAAAAIPLVLAVSGYGFFPRWLAAAGVVVAVALAALYWYFPFFAFLAWVVAVALLRPRLAASSP